MNDVDEERHRLNLRSLRFVDASTEAAYREETLRNSRTFCRVAWALIPVLGGSFGLLDQQVFGADAPLVLTVRAVVVAVALVVLALSFLPRAWPWFVWSSALYILLVGSFCTFLVAMDDGSTTSPYFVGIIMGFAAIYTTVGVGFSRSLGALLVTAALFLATVGLLAPVAAKVLLIYSFFMPGVVVTFAYSGYLVERASRERYATAAQLQRSLAEVKLLGGLLPICASCKKVRDDKGYWSQIESYVSAHSEATFTHGICPDCANELYADFDDASEDEADG